MAASTMDKNKALTKPRDTALAQPEASRQPELFLVPAVDIHETEEAITVVADVPGVTREDVDVSVDKGVLTLRCAVSCTPRKGSWWQEFELHDYFRQFTLPEDVDAEGIGAELRNGVLTVRLPKAEEAKPRRIKVVAK